MPQITYLGHSAFVVEFKKKTILFDPWLSMDNSRIVPPAYDASHVRASDVLFLSHEHGDHFNAQDVKRIYERTFTHVVAPESVFEQISIPENRKVVAYVGDEFNYQGLDVKVMEARHPQSQNPVGYTVSDGSESVYFAGDTYDFHGLSQAKADVCMLPIGGTYTMDVIGALSAIKKIRASHFIPMHYNTFQNIRVDTYDFERKAKKETKSQIHVLPVGHSVQV
ncbi:MBL fold metallo-hydrolase [Candidatus Micrarchaeota archaeon]|nr:MBL fold metallo-hydrolase [Candidatus Micrarchaeota archaeon]